MNCPDNLKQEAVEKAAVAQAYAEGFESATDGDREEVRDAVTATADLLFSAGYEAGIKAARETVDRVLTEWFGDRRPSGSLPRDEWGPDCAGCGNEEYRIDGYCSIECRDNHEVIGELLASLDPKGKEDGK